MRLHDPFAAEYAGFLYLVTEGVDVMRKKNRSFLLMSLISASLLVSVFTIVQAQSPAAPAAKATKWSDPATWPNRKVPVAGDKVTIDAGQGRGARRQLRRR